jgi:hypothetical protein
LTLRDFLERKAYSCGVKKVWQDIMLNMVLPWRILPVAGQTVICEYDDVYLLLNSQPSHLIDALISGMAFCALLHRYRPGSLDMDDIASMPPNLRLETAFELNKELLGVSKVLDFREKMPLFVRMSLVFM